jgi:hypothetical protein
MFYHQSLDVDNRNGSTHLDTSGARKLFSKVYWAYNIRPTPPNVQKIIIGIGWLLEASQIDEIVEYTPMSLFNAFFTILFL